jgi:hypothetical protein
MKNYDSELGSETTYDRSENDDEDESENGEEDDGSLNDEHCNWCGLKLLLCCCVFDR